MSEYIDLRLTAEERAGILLHLEQCQGCKALYTETEKICGLLHGLQDTPVPATLASKIDRIPWEVEQDGHRAFFVQVRLDPGSGSGNGRISYCKAGAAGKFIGSEYGRSGRSNDE